MARTPEGRIHYSNRDRKQWMATLAHANREELEDIYHAMSRRPGYQLVYPAGSTGRTRSAKQQSNLTHCEVRLGNGVTGKACLVGNDSQHAEMAALFDAMLRDIDRRDELVGSLASRYGSGQVL